MHISRLFYKQLSFLVLKLFCVKISVTFPGFLYVHLFPPTTFVQNELNMCSTMVCSIPQNHVLMIICLFKEGLRCILSHMCYLVGTLTSFHFNVFLKMFDMLSQCLVPSITKKSFLTRWFWNRNHL